MDPAAASRRRSGFNPVPQCSIYLLLLLLLLLKSVAAHLLEPSEQPLINGPRLGLDDTEATYFEGEPTPALASAPAHLKQTSTDPLEQAALHPYLVEEASLFSPVFNQQEYLQDDDNQDPPLLVLEPSRVQARRRHLSTMASAPPIISESSESAWLESLGAGEQGSGQLWSGGDADDIQPSSVLSMPGNPFQGNQLEATPLATLGGDMSTGSAAADDDQAASLNRAPMLNRRLPRLTLVAGQIWRYQLPADTFVDEEGDLRHLKSEVFVEVAGGGPPVPLGSPSGDSQVNPLDTYFSWIQYNQSARLLYALPTENQAGRHLLQVLVTDRWSASARETLELHVKQHLSVRAFTHLATVGRLQWDRLRYPSIVDVLIGFIKRLSERLYLAPDTQEFIVKTYAVNDFSIDSTQTADTSLSLSWSNSSLPVHPCPLARLESYLQPLVEESVALQLHHSQRATNLTPSANLIRHMFPDFRLSNISLELRAACQVAGGEEPSTGNSGAGGAGGLRVANKIGMLTWKLGEPIEYQIPGDAFELVSEAGGSLSPATGVLRLSVHTIDGLLLSRDSRYAYLEFDEESGLLYGAPYELKQHAGQRELLLSALHEPTGSRARQVFMVNIEPQELTIVNNRAFKMSLYLGSRLGEFGASQRVLLSRKIVEALRGPAGWHEYHSEPPQFIITDLHKFYMPDYSGSGSGLYAAPSIVDPAASASGASQQQHLVKVVEVVDEELELQQAHRRYFYRLSWTNSSIGFRGDCPVEVIKEQVVYALEQSMLELEMPAEFQQQEEWAAPKNDSTRFYERLRHYFDPEFDLIYLSLEPVGACRGALEVHDAGNRVIADSVDRLEAATIYSSSSSSSSHSSSYSNSDPPYLQTLAGPPRVVVEPDSDEYWSIIVLIVLVMVLIFVIVMFFLGIHTYKMNQEKRFELQVRLAQARQNSMYLSSMLLANQATVPDLCPATVLNQAQQQPNNPPLKEAKSMYAVQDFDNHRKPAASVILDSKEAYLGEPLMRQPSYLAPNPLMRPSSTLTQMAGPTVPWPLVPADKRLSMTLNRRQPNQFHQLQLQSGPMNHSQSILTVASVGGPANAVSLVGQMPHLVYAPALVQAQHQPGGALAGYQPAPIYAQQQVAPAVDSSAPPPLGKSPSYSSSASGTTHSVITNPYYQATNR